MDGWMLISIDYSKDVVSVVIDTMRRVGDDATKNINGDI